MLDLELLKTLVCVVEEGSFTRAARRVHRTQSTVSQQVRKLEQSVGKTLLLRFSNYGRIDGVDFSADCSKTLRVDVHLNGERATTRQVKLGANRTSPTSVPFVIERTVPAS